MFKEKVLELIEKAGYLKEKVDLLTEENKTLKKENGRLLSLSSQFENNLGDLTDQYETLKLAKNIGESGNKDAEIFKKKLGIYIKEIDNCIKLIRD